MKQVIFKVNVHTDEDIKDEVLEDCENAIEEIFKQSHYLPDVLTAEVLNIEGDLDASTN